MFLLTLIVLICPGAISLIDILFRIESSEGMRLFVTVSKALFFLSLLFSLINMPMKRKKNRD